MPTLTRPARRTSVALGSVALLLGMAAPLTPAEAATPVTEVGLAGLERGPDIAVPYLDTTTRTLHVGGEEVPLDYRGVALSLHRVRQGVVLATKARFDSEDPLPRVYRFALDGTRTWVRRNASAVAVSPDGRALALTWTRDDYGEDPSQVEVHRVSDGELTASRTFAMYARTVAFGSHRLLVEAGSQGGVWWRPGEGVSRYVDAGERSLRAADLDADQAVVARSVAGGENTTVLPIPRSAADPWTIGDRQFAGWNPSGDRLLAFRATGGVYGPFTVWDHDGTPVRRFEAGPGTTVTGFQGSQWEDDSHLLFTAADDGDGSSAVVRCSLDGGCELASDVSADRPWLILATRRTA